MTVYTELDGQVALVTGASRGIGFAIAEELTRSGATVVMTARKDDALQQAVKSLPEGKAIGIAGKADDPEHRAEVLDTIAERFGRLDILINNAGINPVYGKLVDLKIPAMEKILSVNLVSTLAWTQGAYHHEGLNFRENHGRVVNLSSVAGATPSPNLGLYGISKAAVNHLTMTLGAELGPEVRVNAIAPAVVKTQFSEALYAEGEDKVAQQYPLKRLGTPEDIAQTAVFLVSDASSWITSQVITLDGGLLSNGGRA